MLLIEYLENSSGKIRGITENLHKLDQQYRKIYDRDLRREINLLKSEIKKIKGDVKHELLLNLEEFRYVHSYFPDLLDAFMEDEFIGPVLKKKSWLLDFKPTPPAEAADKLEQLRLWRLQLKDAKKTLATWVGTVDSKPFVATYPALRGHLKGKHEKDEAAEIVDKVDKILRQEGWLLLISDSLIQIPIAKFMNKIQHLRGSELIAMADFKKAHGRGTVAETSAKRKLDKIVKKREHYEKMLMQVLLANPEYLMSLKKKKNWLSHDKRGSFEKFVESIIPHKVKERSWLNEMKKKINE